MNKLSVAWAKLNIDIKWFLVLLIAALLLWLTNLGDLPLRDWDEGYYGTVAKDMYQSGNWLYLTYYDQPFLLKPPLIIWLINFSYQVGGISEFTTRFPCAFLTALGVPLLYLVGKNLFATRLPAILSSLVYLTLLPVVRHGRLAMIDGMINTFLILSLLCLLKSRQQSRWAIGIGISLGLIALSKGILVIALGGIVAVYILIDHPQKTLNNFNLWLGILFGFLPVFVWYFLQINHYGDLFIKTHFQQQNFDRLLNAVEGNTGGGWYYLIELIKYSFPWLIFLPGALILAVKQWSESWAKLFLTGVILFFGTITLMETKLPWYIMPLYPFFALGIAAYLNEISTLKKSRSKFLIGIFLMLSVAALLGGIYLLIEDEQMILVLAALGVFLTLLFAARQYQKKSAKFAITLAIGLYISLGIFINSNAWIWELNEAFSVKPIGNLIKENTPSNTIIYADIPYSRPSLDFYSERQVLADNQENLQQRAKTSSYLLIDRDNFQNFQLFNAKILGESERFILVSTSDQ